MTNENLILDDEELEKKPAESPAVPADDDKTLESLVSQLGGSNAENVLLKVYRRNDEDDHWYWVADYRPDDMPLEAKLQKKTGGGKFEIRIYTPNKNSPRGGSSVKAYVPLYVDPIELEELPAAPALDFAAALEKIQEANRKMIADMMEKQQLLLENAILKKTKTGGETTLESVLSQIELLRGLVGNNNQGGSVVSQMKEFMQLQNELKQSFGDASESPLLGALDRIVTLAEKKENPARVAYTPPGQLPAATQPEGEEMFFQDRLVKSKIKEQLLLLCQHAAKNRSPVVYAEVVLDSVPEKFYPQLLALVDGEDSEVMSRLSALCPAVADYPEWFTALAVHIAGAFPDDDAENLTPEPSSGISAPAKSEAANAERATGAGDTGNTDVNS